MKAGWHAHRHRIGRLGEDLAVAFLRRNGARITGRNVAVGRGELDIVADIGAIRTVVEVKTVVGDERTAAAAFTDAKALQVTTLAGALEPPISRVDLLTVAIDREGVTIRWSPHAA